ncbi:hypothetical protein TNCT_727861 [Trichonephila clavata]|uniref:Uncharacterized protein n=1 Tax=Trichonephila clavata TaxID=2740835 RepID=A0A8X6FQB2_TRICU|nr:hypothetical protein TNCT_727861 [Trichonephila clavata]
MGQISHYNCDRTLANERVSVPPNFSCSQYLSNQAAYKQHGRYQMADDFNYSSVTSQNGACQNPWQSTVPYHSPVKNPLSVHQYGSDSQNKIRTNTRLPVRSPYERKRRPRASMVNNG